MTNYPAFEITRDDLVDLISVAASGTDVAADEKAALLNVARTADRVSVGNFTYVNGCACPWTLAGLRMDARTNACRFAGRFDALADNYSASQGYGIHSFYDLVVSENA